MKKGITLLPLIFIALFLSNMAFAGGPDLKAKPEPASSWMGYVGLFTGSYNANYQYAGYYYGANVANVLSNHLINNNVSQAGESAGFQAGFQYHLGSPYYFGAVLDGMANSNKGTLTNHFDDNMAATTGALSFDMTTEFRIYYNFDLAAIAGVDITPHTHLYAKAGVSYARALAKLDVAAATLSPFPMLSTRGKDFLNLWGWAFGVGLTHDINKWASVFAEFDYYDYGNPNLDALNDFVPGIVFSETDHLAQHTVITANSIRLGLNIKFNDHFTPLKYFSASSSWMVYVGPFFGNYSADFDYSGTYLANNGSNVSPSNQLFNEEAAQKSVSLGAQLGVQYHLKSPGFFGLVFSSMMNSDKARLTNYVENVTAAVLQSSFVITDSFYLNYTVDLAAIIGADITPHTHIYLKAGASNSKMTHHISLTDSRISVPIPTILETERKNVWGWLVGLGLSYDFNKYLSAFLEYDHYDYGNRDLNPLSNIDPRIFLTTPARVDHLTQDVSVRVNAVHLGLNIKFMDQYSAIRYLKQVRPWIFFVGASGGYYDANYKLNAAYFGNSAAGLVTNELIIVNPLQRGPSAAAQIGIQYHLHSPYFVGVVFTSLFNANRARVSEGIENGVIASLVTEDFNYQLRIHYGVDMAALFGADITPHTHVYVKAGTAYGRLSLNFNVTPSGTNGQQFPFVVPTFEQRETENAWGWLAGLGLSQDITERFTAFVEYNYRDYGSHNFMPLDNFSINLTGAQIDHLVNKVRVTANDVRLGFNVNFEI